MEVVGRERCFGSSIGKTEGNSCKSQLCDTKRERLANDKLRGPIPLLLLSEQPRSGEGTEDLGGGAGALPQPGHAAGQLALRVCPESGPAEQQDGPDSPGVVWPAPPGRRVAVGGWDVCGLGSLVPGGDAAVPCSKPPLWGRLIGGPTAGEQELR